MKGKKQDPQKIIPLLREDEIHINSGLSIRFKKALVKGHSNHFNSLKE